MITSLFYSHKHNKEQQPLLPIYLKELSLIQVLFIFQFNHTTIVPTNYIKVCIIIDESFVLMVSLERLLLMTSGPVRTATYLRDDDW